MPPSIQSMTAGWNLVACCHAAAGIWRHVRDTFADISQAAPAISQEDLLDAIEDELDRIVAPHNLSALAAWENQGLQAYAEYISTFSVPDAASADLPPDWAAPIEAALASLEEKLADPQIPDDVILETIARVADGLPSLLDAMDIPALADALETAMGQAVLTAAKASSVKRPASSPLSAFQIFSVSEFSPLADAVAKLDRKTPVAARLTSADWARVPLELRERAQFSARVESVRFLATVQNKIHNRLALEAEALANGKRAFVDRDSFIRDMRQIAEEEGVQTTDSAGRGTVRDIRSVKRLGLIYDQQTQSAAGYARWKIDHDADVLDAFPAYRLGASTAAVPRGDAFWQSRWAEAGAAVAWEGASQSRMVALKTSPIWRALSTFGTPWPPFDYGSTRDIEDVDRPEAEALGLLTKDAPVPEFQEGSGRADFNAALEASVENVPTSLREWLLNEFGDQVEEVDNKIKWRGNRP